jgi:hypothetical protein
VGQAQKRYQNHAEMSIFETEDNLFMAFSGDLERFFEKELKNSGLYDNIAAYLECSRDEAKVELLRYFFGRHFSKRFPVGDYFNTNYPTLNLIVGFIKKDNHRLLANILQKREANIFIHTIAKRIISEYPDMVIYTIHDAIVCEDGPDVEIVEKIVKEELNKVFTNPKLKKERL